MSWHGIILYGTGPMWVESAGQWHGTLMFSLMYAFFPSARMSVHPSVYHTFSLCSHHRIIMKILWVITNDGIDGHTKCRGQRSKGQGHWGQNPILPFPDCNSSMNSHMVMKWCPKLDVAPKRCPTFSRASVKIRFWPKLGVSVIVTPVWIQVWLWNA